MNRDPARTILVAILGVLAIWLVITRSLAAYLSGIDPATALRLQPDHPIALVAVAERLITTEHTDPARTLLGRALRLHPLSPHALRRLGEMADGSGNGQLASSLMTAAARQSLHESIAVHWTLQKRLQQGRFAEAMRLADALFRTRPDAVDRIAPAFAGLVGNGAAREHLVALLATDPPWRPVFLAHLGAALADARTMLDLLLDLAASTAPPTDGEVNAYLQYLVAKGFTKLAYYAWLQFLPAGRLEHTGLLFNGSFQHKPSGSPFDWRISPGAGVTGEIAVPPDRAGERGLFIAFGPGQIELGEIAQTVLLAPGRYRLLGRQNVQLTGPRRRGLSWRVTCSGGAVGLGEGGEVANTNSSWESFEIPFIVPENDCSAQEVRLVHHARFPSEKIVTGAAWYAAMTIIRD